jgi:thiol-disulfide isomerase/thioredoxin
MQRFLILLIGAVMLATVLRAAGDGLQFRGVNGEPLLLFAPKAKASVMFFVATDCPISNWYAPTIQQVCREYAAKGVDCTLIYEDVDLGAAPATLDTAVRTHLREYRYDSMAAAVDRTRVVAKRAKATITPQAVLVDREGAVRYRGRIDNAYADLGKPRQHVTSHDLRASLDAVLTGKPVPAPETEALGCYITDPASIRPASAQSAPARSRRSLGEGGR